MAWIETTGPDHARGLLARIYDEAVARAGKVWQILRLQSANPRQLRASLELYAATMKQGSALAPRVRETLAVVVSQENDCFY